MLVQESRASLRGGDGDFGSIASISSCNTIRPHETYAIKVNLNDNINTIEADLETFKKEVRKRKLKQEEQYAGHQRRISNSSDDAVSRKQINTDEDKDMSDAADMESAAARLQRLHERSGRSSPRRPTLETRRPPALEIEAFPTLGTAPKLVRHGVSAYHTSHESRSPGGTYAGVVKNFNGWSNIRGGGSTPSKHFAGGASSPRRIDREWVVLENEQYVDDQSEYDSVAPSASATVTGRSPTRAIPSCTQGNYTHGAGGQEEHQQPLRPLTRSNFTRAPRFAIDKRTDNRHRRKLLPEEWSSGGDIHYQAQTNANSPSATSSMKTATVRSPACIAPEGQEFGHGKEKAHIRHNRNKALQESSPRTVTYTKSLSSLTSPASPSKDTAGRKTNFASPTAASQQRSAVPAKSSTVAKSMHPARLHTGVPNKHVRAEDHEPVGPTKSSIKGHLHRSYCDFPDFSRTRNSNQYDTLSSMNDSDLATSLGQDGTHEHPDSHTASQSSPGNEDPPSGRRKTNKNLKITIPSLVQDYSRTASPANPSRIPRPTSTLCASPASYASTSTPLPAMKPKEASSSFSVTPQNDSEEHILVRKLSGERAALLEPIVRRLSSAASQRSSRSGTVSSKSSKLSELVCDTILASANEELDRENPTIEPSHEVDKHTSADQVALEIATVAASVPPSSMPCSPKAQPSSKGAFGSASSYLLGTIKQTAADHARRQGEDVEKKHSLTSLFRDPSSSEFRKAATKASPEHDPAVLAFGPIKSNDLHAPRRFEASSKPNSRVSSLRATASAFVPSSEHTKQLITRKMSTGFSKIGDLPITPVDQPIPPALSPQSMDYDIRHLSEEEWYALPYHERSAIREKRKERGSSNASNQTHGSSMSVANTYQSVSPNKHLFDWFSAASNGSSIKFNRAPLPSMNEMPEEVRQATKGWGIGSAAPGWRYGWHGGDGLEISFVGHGPDAEKFPQAPINFHDYKKGTVAQTTPTISQQPPGHNRFRTYNDTPTAPRKMRDRATRSRYSQCPCGDFVIEEAVEHIGNAGTRQRVDGWCHDCVPAH